MQVVKVGSRPRMLVVRALSGQRVLCAALLLSLFGVGIEEFFKDHAKEISTLYAQGEASKGDIVEHVLDSDEELRTCDQGKSYFGFRNMMTNPSLSRQLRNLAEQTSQIARKRGLDPNKTFLNLGDRLFGEAGAAHGAYGRISRKLRQVVGEHSGGGGRHVRDTLSRIRRQAFRLREQPPEDWDSVDTHFSSVRTRHKWRTVLCFPADW